MRKEEAKNKQAAVSLKPRNSTYSGVSVCLILLLVFFSLKYYYFLEVHIWVLYFHPFSYLSSLQPFPGAFIPLIL